MKTSENTIRVWDPVVRIGHWVLVVAFFTAYLVDDDFLTVHVWAGYVVGAVVAIRVLWGFVGTRHARFSDFVASPATIAGYVRDLAARRARHYVGHNPAGGVMIVALLASLTVTVGSGLVVYALDEHSGPLAGWVGTPVDADIAPPAGLLFADEDRHERETERAHESREDDWEDVWEEVHEVFANVTLLLIAFHVAGVLLSSFLGKENLVRAMVTGRKRPRPER